ncbi:MAG: fluoride efflux transporter CrcB [Salinibacterium sp.]|nr:fluoride efflux transporter CrcB [Salinibacterium sp.]
MSALVVAATIVAGALGAVLRYLTSRALAPRSRFPWAVLVVNVVGSAIGGVVLGLATIGGVDADIRLIVLTGLCGGLTTFSTWSVETVQLVREGKWRWVGLSVSGNLVLGIGAAAAAYAITVASAG